MTVVHSRQTVPAGHGEIVERPEYSAWAKMMAGNRAASARWSFLVGGVTATMYRRDVRRALLSEAERFSARLGVEVRVAGDQDEPIAMTGHQPELYHPGVWVKNFELERLGRDTGCTCVDLVVDSDAYDHVSVATPCLSPEVTRCRQYLSVGASGVSFSMAPVPDRAHITQFCDTTHAALGTLPAPAIGKHFSAFCELLSSSADDSNNLAELITMTRRRYEAGVGTGYLELMLTALCGTPEFLRFVVEIVGRASEFAAAYNEALDAYRERTRTRSAAQPFPNLETGPDGVELPLWLIEKGRRSSVWAKSSGGRTILYTADDTVAALTADPDAAVATLVESGVVIAPKAVLLTMFVRMFCCDLFIHGIGGARYDQITDAVMRRFFEVEPPGFVVASMTMYLPLGVALVSPADIARAKERLHRLAHNPDALLGDLDFDDPCEVADLTELVNRKRALVESIGRPEADRKTLGLEIKRVNADLASRLSPVRASLEAELARLESQFEATEILTDRTYPWCFWEPGEIADKVW